MLTCDVQPEKGPKNTQKRLCGLSAKMLILEQVLRLSGTLGWSSKMSPTSLGCTWLVIQSHVSSKIGRSTESLSRFVRAAKGDPYAEYSFRVITVFRPYCVLAVSSGFEEILQDFTTLSERLRIHAKQPSLSVLNAAVTELVNHAPLPPSPSSTGNIPLSSSDASSSSSSSSPHPPVASTSSQS